MQEKQTGLSFLFYLPCIRGPFRDEEVSFQVLLCFYMLESISIKRVPVPFVLLHMALYMQWRMSNAMTT